MGFCKSQDESYLFFHRFSSQNYIIVPCFCHNQKTPERTNFTIFHKHSFHSRTTVISAHPGGCFYKLVRVLNCKQIISLNLFPFSQMDWYIFFRDFAFMKYYDIFFDFLFRLTDKAMLMPGTFPGAFMYHALHHAAATSTFQWLYNIPQNPLCQ